MATPDLELRRAADGELEEIVALAGRSLGWAAGEPHGALFRWKHLENPAGASPMWVAVGDDGLVGVRAFLRWPLCDDDGAVRAVRAVDTATAPEHQGRGVFRRLTTHAVDELVDEGVDLVFNTPNDQSRPGYLSMGWEVVGRVPIAARPSGLRSAQRMASARTPAAKWSRPCPVGVPVGELDTEVLAGLLAARAGHGLRTERTVAHLRWRYGFEPLHYRAIGLGADPAEGIAVVRLRDRGRAVEATVCELLVPEPGRRRRLLSVVARSTGADYLVVAGGGWRDGLVPLPGQGPVLTWRALRRAGAPPLAGWDLELGDVELL